MSKDERESAAMYVLIDDDPLIRMVFEDIMQAEGHQIQAYGAAADAVDTLLSQELEGLIIDYHLGEQSGVKMVHQLQQDGLLTDLPIMVMSADSSEEVIQDCESHHLPFVSKSDPDLFAKIYDEMSLHAD